jgi:hypothetical protein
MTVIVRKKVVQKGVYCVGELGGLAELIGISLSANCYAVCAIIDWDFKILDQCTTLTIRSG